MGGRQEDRVTLQGGPWLVLLTPQAGRELDSLLGDEHSLALPFFGTGMKTDLFQSCGHC